MCVGIGEMVELLPTHCVSEVCVCVAVSHCMWYGEKGWGGIGGGGEGGRSGDYHKCLSTFFMQCTNKKRSLHLPYVRVVESVTAVTVMCFVSRPCCRVLSASPLVYIYVYLSLASVTSWNMVCVHYQHFTPDNQYCYLK